MLQAAFFEAVCQDINPEEKTIVACFPPDSGMDESCFKIPYDVLVLGEWAVLLSDLTPTPDISLLYPS